MKSAGRFVLALGVVCLLSVNAQAQGQGRGMMGMGGGVAILMAEEVHKELGLTPDQVAKVKSIAESSMGQMRDKFAELRDLSQEERREKMAALTKEMNEGANKSLKEVLKPEQMKRYEQIGIQARGIEALLDKEIQDKLKLTADQKSKIQGFREDMMGSMREIFQSAQDDREGAMRKMAEMRKEVMTKASGLLTEEQKSTWKELIGSPFEVRMQPGRRPA